ncbi:hypothetical protein CHS0354_032323 [Potamilus streckersoni]|uniref:Uncharacterized protein n=1 Tax=Potamilus streckersoni TaxID=2493646 RepID=A0AAE0VHW0_9BIVA|nr:hypothetical protein CHS0354_032323 [Potamilus streckersoni]
MNLRQETHIDVLLDIEGFDEENAIKFARFILYRYYGDKESIEDFTKSLQEREIISSFKSNPLLLLFLVHAWYRNKSLPSQYHELYIQILDCLVERFIRKAKSKQVSSVVQFSTVFGRSDSKIPSLQSTLFVQTFGNSFLKSLCRTAHHFLLYAEQPASLVISKEEILKELGTMDENVFTLLLEIGILSKSDTLSPLNKRILVSFLHTTIQEFLASVYLIFEKRNLDPFLAALNSLDDILRNENIVVYVCGLHPKSGWKMFNRICEVCETDPDVRGYRDNNDEIVMKKIENLNRIHRTCLKTTQTRFPLKLTDIRVKSFENVEALSSDQKCLKNAKSLCIIGGRKTYSLMDILNMKGIEHLSLNYVQLLSGNLNLSTSKDLRYLKLQSVTLNTRMESLLKGITKCKNLKELCLQDMPMNDHILDLTKLRNLTRLRLEGLKSLSIECSESICRSISNCLQLRKLHLLNKTLRSFFPDLSNLSQLTDLALGLASSIDGSGQSICRQLTNCRKMRFLVFKDI